ncbi:hypothetical protein PLESTF_001899300 [Pleodorina starrii]|nr:hypothetical protein PLESTF_001899300 [Pleodorina starrii]
MADDTLPYIYVYGALQHGSSAAALGGGSSAPSLHRFRLGGDDGGGAVWEAVELLKSARSHPARGVLGVASGGAVTLLGGVRNGRRGVEVQLQLVLPATVTVVARCRRVIVEQLRRVAPREVQFAHPSTAPQGKEDHGGSGGDGGGGGGGRGPRPCVVLAAALSLHSRSGPFDDFFEDLDDGEEEWGSPLCNRSSGGGGNASGDAYLRRQRQGHDARCRATTRWWSRLAVVALVMGRTHIWGDWEPRFLAQMFQSGSPAAAALHGPGR